MPTATRRMESPRTTGHPETMIITANRGMRNTAETGHHAHYDEDPGRVAGLAVRDQRPVRRWRPMKAPITTSSPNMRLSLGADDNAVAMILASGSKTTIHSGIDSRVVVSASPGPSRTRLPAPVG